MRHYSRIGAGLPALLILFACGHDSAPSQPTPLPCSYTLSSTSLSFGASAGSAAITITTGSQCTWSAVSSGDWMTASAGSGTGTGTITITASANSSETARTATLTVAGQTVSVRQDGSPPAPCTLEISPASATIDKNGGSGTFGVTTPAHCQWSAASDAAWLRVTSGGGTGSGTVGYAVDRNEATVDRSGTIAVGERRFVLTQSRDRDACQYSVAPVEFSPCMSTPSAFSVTVTTQPGCSWTAASDAGWIAFTGGQSGEGSGVISFTISNNWDVPRVGIVMVRWPTITAGQNVRVSQAGCRYAVSTGAIAVAAAGGTSRFDVFQQSDPTSCGGPLQNACMWTAVADVSWITVTTTMPQFGDNPVSFTVAPNESPTSRSGTITVRNLTVRITQAGR